MRILGVDPGSIVAGYGCIEVRGREFLYLTHGVLRLGDSDVPMVERLACLYEGLLAVIDEFRPDALAVEKAFVARNVLSAMRLGESRGVILLAARHRSLRVSEYSPTEVKSALCGFGRADKPQIQSTVQMILGKQHFLGKETRHDATDALAIAMCAAQLTRRPEAETFRRI